MFYNCNILIPDTEITCLTYLYIVDSWTQWGYHLTRTVQNGCAQLISEILHVENRILCCIETYLKPILHLSKCSNWLKLKQVYWKSLYLKCAFLYKFAILKYHPPCLNDMTFMRTKFPFIQLLTNFGAVFIWFLLVIKYISKYPKFIWWIMSFIVSQLLKINKYK